MGLYWILLIFIATIGVLVGSFLNVVIYRFELTLKFWQGRSQCMSCHHVLEWFDLIPVMSFVTIGGKCRYCRAHLSWQYPLVELSTGLLAAGIFFVQFPNLSAVFTSSWLDWVEMGVLWFALSQAIVIFVYDLKTMFIPDASLKLLIGAGCLWIVLQTLQSGVLFSGLWTGIILATGIFAIYVGSKKQGMGFGDVELILGLGFFFPLYLAFWFFFGSFLIGSVWGILYVLWSRKTTLRIRMPFGPSIILAWVLLWVLSPYWPLLQNYWAVLQ